MSDYESEGFKPDISGAITRERRTSLDRIKALCQLLVDDRYLTPYGARQILAVIEDENNREIN